jgi:hypothetical protein
VLHSIVSTQRSLLRRRKAGRRYHMSHAVIGHYR